MADRIEFENIETNRLCLVRLKPNQDLVEGLESACEKAGLKKAVLRAGMGSLNEASFLSGGHEITVAGPGLEIITLTGEISPGDDNSVKAVLFGTVCDRTGKVTGGQFLRGKNIVCITVELSLLELRQIKEKQKSAE